jgi:hypothetical protein
MNTNEILGDNDDTRFFTEIHLLAGKLVPVVAIHSLGASHAESLSLVLVINDTKLLMSCVKCFELGISNTCDEGVCGKEWWP